MVASLVLLHSSSGVMLQKTSYQKQSAAMDVNRQGSCNLHYFFFSYQDLIQHDVFSDRLKYIYRLFKSN